MPIPLFKIKVAQKGRIEDIKEIVVRIVGLPTCLNGQLVDLGRGVRGIVMGYDENDVLVLALGDPSRLRMGSEVTGVDKPSLMQRKKAPERSLWLPVLRQGHGSRARLRWSLSPTIWTAPILLKFG